MQIAIFIAISVIVTALLIYALIREKKNKSLHAAENNPVPLQKPKRLRIEDVKPGEKIRVEWDRVKGKIAWLTCLNNDPLTKKIHLQVTWSDFQKYNLLQKEEVVWPYACEELKNFHLLNERKNEPPDVDVLEVLRKKLDLLLEKEDYEAAYELQKQIEKIKAGEKDGSK